MTSNDQDFSDWETKTEQIYKEIVPLEKLQQDLPSSIADILTDTLSKPLPECMFCGTSHTLPCEEQLAARKKREKMHTNVEFTEAEMNFLRERLGGSLVKDTYSTTELKEYLSNNNFLDEGY